MALKLKCPRHSRYSGTDSPRASCEACMFIYQTRLKAEMNRVQVVDGKASAKRDSDSSAEG